MILINLKRLLNYKNNRLSKFIHSIQNFEKTHKSPQCKIIKYHLEKFAI